MKIWYKKGPNWDDFINQRGMTMSYKPYREILLGCADEMHQRVGRFEETEAERLVTRGCTSKSCPGYFKEIAESCGTDEK
jgi:hypothetical protein